MAPLRCRRTASKPNAHARYAPLFAAQRACHSSATYHDKPQRNMLRNASDVAASSRHLMIFSAFAFRHSDGDIAAAAAAAEMLSAPPPADARRRAARAPDASRRLMPVALAP